jgi:hypothetical protein
MTNENNQKMEYVDIKYPTRTILIGLWITFMFLFICCDVVTFSRTSNLSNIVGFFMGLFPINEYSFVIASLMISLPTLMIIAMIIVNLFIRLTAIRWINIIAGIIYTLGNIGNIVNIISDPLAYYWIYLIVEIIITILIIIKSIKWDKNI